MGFNNIILSKSVTREDEKKKKKNHDITLQVPSQPLPANQGQPCVSGIEQMCKQPGQGMLLLIS